MTNKEEYEIEKSRYNMLIKEYPEGELVPEDDPRVQFLCSDSLNKYKGPDNRYCRKPDVIQDIEYVKYKGDWYYCFVVYAFYKYKGTENKPLFFFAKPGKIHLWGHSSPFISINDIEEIVTAKEVKDSSKKFWNEMIPKKILWKNTQLSKPFSAKESDILAPYLFRTKSCNAIADSDFAYSSTIGYCFEHLLSILILKKVPAAISEDSYYPELIKNNTLDVPSIFSRVCEEHFFYRLPQKSTEYKDLINMYNASIPLISSIKENEPQIQFKCTFGPFNLRQIDMFLNGFVLDIKTSANITWLKKYIQQVYEYFLAGTLDYLSIDNSPFKIQSPIYRIGLYEARYNQIDYCNVFELPAEKLITDLIQYRNFRRSEANKAIYFDCENRYHDYSEEAINQIYDSVTDEKIKEYIDWFVNTTPPKSWFDKYCSLS